MTELANPQDAQRRAETTTTTSSSNTMTYANSNSTSTGSRRRARRRSQLLSKAQHIPSPGTCPGAGERAPLSPQRSFRLNRLTGQESPKKYERLSQRRLLVDSLEEPQQEHTASQQQQQQQHDFHSASSTEAETSSIEEPDSVVRVQQHQSSSGSVSSPHQTATPTQAQPVQQHAAARRIQRVSRQWSNKQKVRRQAQLNEFQRLQKKQEEEYKRIERIRARSKHEPIRTSLKQYQKTVQTNQKYYGFTEGEEVSAKPVAPQRRLSKDDLDVKDSSEEDNASKQQQQEEEEEEKSITLEQLQQDQECEKFLQKMPLRRRSSGSNDSTLSSLKLLNKPQTAPKSTTITTTKQQPDEEFPVPNEIIVSPKTNLEESEISLQASWDNLHAETRWEAQPPPSNTSPKKKQPDKFERIIFRRPVPAILKKESENDRYAVHPRTVYGKPKTKKAIQPYDERWAAQRKQQKFPTNASRWAAQPKKNFPVNVSRMPKRKKSDENNHHSHCRMPKRQDSQDDTSQKTPPAPPRRGRRRRSLKELPNNTNTQNTYTHSPPEQRGVNRTRSLGEVKQMVSATRIQALFRKYREQQHYRMKRQLARKQEIERELQSELEDIHASLRLRQESIRNGMERAVEAGVWEDDRRVAHNQDELIETLKEQVAELEQQKSRLLHQCDRVRAHNQRLESGNKARETAVKEVKGRLAKLQQIQSKLHKVKENFQNEYVMTSAEMDALNDKLISESHLQERTLECIGEVMDHVRPILDQRNPQLLEELEDMVVGLA